MAKYEVTINGSQQIVDTASLGLPDSASPEQIESAIKALVAGSAPSRPKATGATASVLDSLGMGITDPVYGLGQLAAKGMAAVLPKGLGGNWAERNLKDFEGVQQEREQEYQQKRGDNAGFDTGRVIGSILTALPLGGVGAAPGAITAGVNAAARPLLGRTLLAQTAGKAQGLAAQGAKLGAIESAAQPVDPGDDFWSQKALQTGLGAGVGAVAAPAAGWVGEKVTGATRKAIDRSRARAAAAGPESLDAAAQRVLTHTLPPEQLARMTDDVKNGLIDDVKKALETSAEVTPEKLRRMADFREAGIDPTRAWITRDPVDFTRQQNLGAVEGVGEPIQRAEANAARRFGEVLTEGRPPGAGSGQYEQGAAMARSVEAEQAAMDRYVKELYDNVQEVGKAGQVNRITEAVPPGARGQGQVYEVAESLADPKGLAARIEERLMNDGDAWPGSFQKLFASYGPDKPLTFRELHRLYKVANSKLATGGPDTSALRNIKHGLMEEMTRISEAGSQAHKAATAAAKANFARQELSPAFGAAKEGKLLEEGFFDKYVVGAPYKSVERMWRSMSHDPDFTSQARAAALDRLTRAAFGTQDVATGKPALDRFSRELNQKGMKEKLKLILDKPTYSKVMLLERLGQYMRAPAGERMNRSNTAGTTMGFAMRILRTLKGGSVTSDVLRAGAGAVPAREAQGLASAGADDIALRSQFAALPPQVQQYLLRTLSPAVAAGLGQQFNDGQ